MDAPETRYAVAPDGLSIAYQTLGTGPPDVLFLRGWHTNLEHDWDERVLAHVFRRIGSFGRLMLLDRRGTGLSDRLDGELPTLDTRMDDITATLDAAGSDRVAIFAVSSTATALGCVYAAVHPERTSTLVLYDPEVRGTYAPDYPWAEPEDVQVAALDEWTARWGQTEFARDLLRGIAPSRADDQALIQWLASSQRRSASPRGARALLLMEIGTDVRDVLGSIRTPTLVLHRGDASPVELAGWVASRIPGARLVRLPGRDHMLVSGETDRVLDEVERFVTGTVRTAPELDRVLATVLFTDIVGSSEQLARIGDRGWADLVQRHHAVVRRLLEVYRGRELDTAGDGFFAVFDGPARAVRCAMELTGAVQPLGLSIRVGVHTGECEVADGKVAGLAVVVAARVMAQAPPNTVLITSTVKDLAAGAGLQLTDVGERTLKGVPGSWHLFSVH